MDSTNISLVTLMNAFTNYGIKSGNIELFKNQKVIYMAN